MPEIKNEDKITIREFVEMLSALYRRDTGTQGAKKMVERKPQKENVIKQDELRTARAEGWVDAQDELEADQPMPRRAAAAIIHRFLRIVLKEADEDCISSAEKLRDLYDCRVCANHIAQVYEKGIMDAVILPGLGLYIFDGRGLVKRTEAKDYIQRVFDRKKRHESLLCKL